MGTAGVGDSDGKMRLAIYRGIDEINKSCRVMGTRFPTIRKECYKDEWSGSSLVA